MRAGGSVSGAAARVDGTRARVDGARASVIGAWGILDGVRVGIVAAGVARGVVAGFLRRWGDAEVGAGGWSMTLLTA